MHRYNHVERCGIISRTKHNGMSAQLEYIGCWSLTISGRPSPEQTAAKVNCKHVIQISLLWLLTLS